MRVRETQSPAMLRLSRLAGLTATDLALLESGMLTGHLARSRREILREGQEITGAQIIVSGWAVRARLLADGRRQFLSFLLPGDLIGHCRHSRPLAVSTIVALTDVRLCAAPASSTSASLAEAYAVSQALDEAYLLSHITRLGRLNAQERIGDLMLEFHERLTLAGLVTHNGFEMPLTQEALGDALGLTSVHINRMLQLMRREGDLTLKGGRLILSDPPVLARKVGRAPIHVTANPPQAEA